MNKLIKFIYSDMFKDIIKNRYILYNVFESDKRIYLRILEEDDDEVVNDLIEVALKNEAKMIEIQSNICLNHFR